MVHEAFIRYVTPNENHRQIKQSVVEIYFGKLAIQNTRCLREGTDSHPKRDRFIRTP
jgi:hypothetical protein